MYYRVHGVDIIDQKLVLIIYLKFHDDHWSQRMFEEFEAFTN